MRGAKGGGRACRATGSDKEVEGAASGRDEEQLAEAAAASFAGGSTSLPTAEGDGQQLDKSRPSPSSERPGAVALFSTAARADRSSEALRAHPPLFVELRGRASLP